VTKKEVGELMKTVVAAYPNFEITPERVNLWVYMLGDIDNERAKVNLMRHIKLSKYIPTIADIRGETQEELERREWEVIR